jgi:hypothetical protein
MKKVLITGLLFFLTSLNTEAQSISKNALGLRLGDNDGFGGEVSYQRALSKKNRFEADFGWRNNSVVNAIKVVGLYQWVWNIDGGFNWYAGVGGGLGSWNYNQRYKDSFKYNINDEDKGVYFFAAGDIGIEYNFDIPLMLSLDLRPELYINGYGNSFGPDIALGVRYQF